MCENCAKCPLRCNVYTRLDIELLRQPDLQSIDVRSNFYPGSLTDECKMQPREMPLHLDLYFFFCVSRLRSFSPRHSDVGLSLRSVGPRARSARVRGPIGEGLQLHFRREVGNEAGSHRTLSQVSNDCSIKSKEIILLYFIT